MLSKSTKIILAYCIFKQNLFLNCIMKLYNNKSTYKIETQDATVLLQQLSS